MGSEHYCLRWNNHQSNLLGVFSQLLQDESLVDVTLACSEGASIRAHKVVLSACSSYFQSLFLDHPSRHPIVILKDVRFSELRTLVEFMYKGEVNVQYCQLSALLKTAESLKVKGLAEMTNQSTALRDPDHDADRLRAPSLSNTTSRPASDFLQLDTSTPPPQPPPSSHPTTPASSSSAAAASSSNPVASTSTPTTPTSSANNANNTNHSSASSSPSPTTPASATTASSTHHTTTNNNNNNNNSTPTTTTNKRSADHSAAECGHQSSPKEQRCGSRSPALRIPKTRSSSSSTPSPSPLDLYNRKGGGNRSDYVGSPDVPHHHLHHHHHHHLSTADHDDKSLIDVHRSPTPDDDEDEDEDDDDDAMSNDVVGINMTINSNSNHSTPHHTNHHHHQHHHHLQQRSPSAPHPMATALLSTTAAASTTAASLGLASPSGLHFSSSATSGRHTHPDRSTTSSSRPSSRSSGGGNGGLGSMSATCTAISATSPHQSHSAAAARASSTEPVAGPSGLGPVQSVPLSLKKEIDWDRSDDKSIGDCSSDYTLRHPHESEATTTDGTTLTTTTMMLTTSLGGGGGIGGGGGGDTGLGIGLGCSGGRSAADNIAHHLVGDQIYPCMYCGATFPHQSKLTRHILSHSLETLKFRESPHYLHFPHDLGAAAAAHFAATGSRTPLDGCLMDGGPSDGGPTHMDIEFAAAAAAAAAASLGGGAGSGGGGANSMSPTGSSGDPGTVVLCKFCGKSFPDVSSLINHLPVHTGDRPFKCEFCGKAFKLRHHMKDHCRVHTGERPFRCGMCGKTFSRSTILKAHEKTHYPKYVRKFLSPSPVETKDEPPN